MKELAKRLHGFCHWYIKSSTFPESIYGIVISLRYSKTCNLFLESPTIDLKSALVNVSWCSCIDSRPANDKASS